MGTHNLIFIVLSAFIFVIGYSNGQFTPEDLTVDIPVLGKVLGRNVTATSEGVDQSNRKPYIQFLGMPYASIPTRFLPSILNEGPLNATGDTYAALTAGLQCYQPNGVEGFMSEDCLSINVYTPKKYTGNDSDLLPVIVFFHGGAFTVGAGSLFSPIRIMNRDVVYVSFNYRLGLAGFYCLENDDVPGNAAMYDVINALTWVQKHVRYFGGNPDLVTIAGQSAGSVTVTHLLTSPLARGLFHRAIAASGSALNAWGTTVNPISASLKIASMTGCYANTPNPNLTSIAICMRSIVPQALVNAVYTYQVTERQQGRLGFEVVSPVVQNFEMPTYSKFMEEHPLTILERGGQANVPLLMGNTRHDGSYVLGVVYNRFLVDNGLQNDVEFLSSQLVPSMLKALGIDDYPGGIYDSLAKTYLQDAYRSGDFNELYPGLIDLFSVFFFKGGCYNTALLHSKINNNTYWYSFDFRGSASLFTSLYPGGEAPPFPGGITHTDDLIYTHLLTFASFNAVEYEVSSRMLDYWANFATHGDPTPTSSSLTNWPELSSSSQGFLSINTNSVPSAYYPDSWVGVGLETVPEPTTTTTAGPTTTGPITTSGPIITSTTETIITSTSGPIITSTTETIFTSTIEPITETSSSTTEPIISSTTNSTSDTEEPTSTTTVDPTPTTTLGTTASDITSTEPEVPTDSAAYQIQSSITVLSVISIAITLFH